jgi:hypothetical protein
MLLQLSDIAKNRSRDGRIDYLEHGGGKLVLRYLDGVADVRSRLGCIAQRVLDKAGNC